MFKPNPDTVIAEATELINNVELLGDGYMKVRTQDLEALSDALGIDLDEVLDTIHLAQVLSDLGIDILKY